MIESNKFDKIKKMINMFNGEDFKHYFIIENPEWDDQKIYYNISYIVESHVYIEVFSMIKDDSLTESIKEIKNEFSLPVYVWKKVMVEYGK
ncbi:hypothetical protein EBB07_28970 [Paenibacillaceae bacterium]|nr:hypothetical protein EBB07_28970 [Paenibacillaceae bacterium]